MEPHKPCRATERRLAHAVAGLRSAYNLLLCSPQEAEATLAQLQQAVQAQRELQQQAERGSLRGPALAPLELALRRLRLARTSSTSKEECAGEPCYHLRHMCLTAAGCMSGHLGLRSAWL